MQSRSCVRHAITRSGIGSFGESRPVSRMVTGAMAGAVPQFGPVAEPLVTAVVQALRDLGARVQTGVFGTDMKVALVNDGPVTIVLDL